MGLRTIVLKIYKPGREKKRILDEAIYNYSEAFRFLLDRARREIAVIGGSYRLASGPYRAGALMKWVDRDLSEELDRFKVQPFKDSLKFELGMVLAGYLNLMETGADARLPRAEGSAERPVYFCRYDTRRSYCLLYDREKNRYWAKLYLLNKDAARTTDIKTYGGNRLEYVCEGSGAFECNRRKVNYIIVPLSFGKYQERFLRDALIDPKTLRTARLMKRGKDYYLAVSIDTGKAEALAAETYMGVGRGLDNSLVYTTVDKNGDIIGSGPIPGTGGPGGRAASLHELHKAANNITEIAQKNKSQVIVQNLEKIGDEIRWSDSGGNECRPVYDRRTYIRLAELLDYKLAGMGLPSPVRVSSSDIFYRCFDCGFYSKKNRFSRDMFICTKCGATMGIEELGSLNLARKLIRYGKSRIKVKVAVTPGGARFTSKLIGLDCFIPHDENQPEVLRQEIQRLLEDMRQNREVGEILRGNEYKRRSSLLKKFGRSADCMDLIEFI